MSSSKKKNHESILKQKSPAEFFAENKNIAGFDNPGKSLYTTIRELVENSLDSAESIAILPDIEISVEEISLSQFNSLIGLVSHERIDEELYGDFEKEKEKEKRLARELRQKEKMEKAMATGKKVISNSNLNSNLNLNLNSNVNSRMGRGKADSMFFVIKCKDNGKGMSHEDIPNMLGRVLSGTKYGLKQTRGKFGLGAKMALIWSKMSTGLPIEIWSAQRKQNFVSYCKLDIDIHRNMPNIFAHEKKENEKNWHGAELKVIIEGNWTFYRSKIINYLRQMAVITPYANFIFHFISNSPEKNVSIQFARRTDVMPSVPCEAKYHPSAVDLLLIKRLISETTSSSLSQFLQHDFDCIGKGLANRLIGELGSEFSCGMDVKQLTDKQIVRIHQLFRQAKFDDPDGQCLSPAGEYNLRLGIIKELHPDLVATHQTTTHVFEGHPFIVEAGVSLGGKNVKQGINVFRFANRIPLLFEAGGDVITRTANKRINWSNYKINPNSDKVGVFVSIVSTKIPFKGTGKEFIGDDITQISSAVKSALMHCCLQLKTKIVKKMRARERLQRKNNIVKYVPDVSRSVSEVLLSICGQDESKRRKLNPDHAILVDKVLRKEINESVIKQKLMQHVEQVDMDMALEYATQSGMDETKREDFFLNCLDFNTSVCELHTSSCVLKLFTASLT